MTGEVVYACRETALAYYRNAEVPSDAPADEEDLLQLSGAVGSLGGIGSVAPQRLRLERFDEDSPLHVLVPSAGARSGSRSVAAHLCSQKLPPSSLRKVGNGIYVTSPELTFFHLAAQMDLPEAVALGMELCGSYRRRVEVPVLGTSETTFITDYRRAALTTPQDLLAFADSMGRAKGVRRVRKALEYVLEGSASPMETVIYLLLCLPRRLGGYALPTPELNPPVDYTSSGRRYVVASSWAAPDLLWRDCRLDLEYQSTEFHTSGNRAHDSMRRKALEAMGYEVIELTSDEVLSVSVFHAIALRIARRVGRQIRPQAEGSFVERRAALRSALLVFDKGGADTASVSAQGAGLNGYPANADDFVEADEIWSDDFSGLDELNDGTFDFDALDNDANSYDGIGLPIGDDYPLEAEIDDGGHIFGASGSVGMHEESPESQ